MLRSPWFPIGLYWGIAAVAVAVVTGCIWRFAAKRPAPVAGILMAGATMAAIGQIEGTSVWLLVALSALVTGAVLADVLGLPVIAWPILLAPGALVLAYRTGVAGPAWVQHLLLVSVLLGGAFVVQFDRCDRMDALGPGLTLISAVGLFLCAPDTDQALVLLGAGTLVGMTGWPLRLTRLGSIGSAAWVAVFAWIVATGGISRPAPTIAGIACLGVLALAPAATSLFTIERRDAPRRLPTRPALLLLGTHVLFVLIASRVAGVRSPTGRAILVLAVATAAAMAVLFDGLHGVQGTVGAPDNEEGM